MLVNKWIVNKYDPNWEDEMYPYTYPDDLPSWCAPEGYDVQFEQPCNWHHEYWIAGRTFMQTPEPPLEPWEIE